MTLPYIFGHKNTLLPERHIYYLPQKRIERYPGGEANTSQVCHELSADTVRYRAQSGCITSSEIFVRIGCPSSRTRNDP